MLGRIPADRLYQPGLNILKMWPMPNDASTATGAQLRITRPAESILGYQPAFASTISRHQSLRVSVKYQGAIQRQQVFNGTIPGFNDSKMVHPRIGTEGVTVNYSLNPTTFIEATYGRAGNQLAACGPTPSFCNNTAVPTNDISNLNNAGLADCRCCFRKRRCSTRTTTRTSILTEAACRSSMARGSCGRRTSHGATGSSRSATTRARRRTSISRASSTSTPPRTSSSA